VNAIGIYIIWEMVMLNIFPDNPNHDKNMAHLFTTDDDPNGQKYAWYKNVFPEWSENDFFAYIDAKVCAVCATAFTKELPRNAYHGDPLCQRCIDICDNVIDLEHLIQLKEYLKKRKNNDGTNNKRM